MDPKIDQKDVRRIVFLFLFFIEFVFHGFHFFVGLGLVAPGLQKMGAPGVKMLLPL